MHTFFDAAKTAHYGRRHEPDSKELNIRWLQFDESALARPAAANGNFLTRARHRSGLKKGGDTEWRRDSESMFLQGRTPQIQVRRQAGPQGSFAAFCWLRQLCCGREPRLLSKTPECKVRRCSNNHNQRPELRAPDRRPPVRQPRECRGQVPKRSIATWFLCRMRSKATRSRFK